MYSLTEICWIVLAAIIIDRIVGDPYHLPHPVIWIGRFIQRMEYFLLNRWKNSDGGARNAKVRGMYLLTATLFVSFIMTYVVVKLAAWVHPWLGYAVQAWLISTTLAVKGLVDAAKGVYDALKSGEIYQARRLVGEIVGRDTEQLDEPEIVRATVETVAENTVDAFVSPLVFALIGGAPLAMLYRATNTLDSMVGYKNEKYIHFGWASARWDDVLNWLPARLTGLLLIIASLLYRSLSAKRAFRAILRFSRLHPSPNSGIPEAAVAGAIGIRLGGRNVYGKRVSQRPYLGWELQSKRCAHILLANQLLIRVSDLCCGGLICMIIAVSFM